jgi:hypothetical protein
MKLVKEVLIVLRTILTPPVGMMDKAGFRLLPCHCHMERLYDEVPGESGSQSIPYNLSVEKIPVGSAVEPSFIGGNIGNITDPDLVGGSNGKLLVEEVVCYRQGMFRVCGGLEPPHLFTAYSQLLSETPYSAYTGCDAMD